MGKPKAPPPPDPKATAAAQTGTNVSTAVANAFLNNVNQYTPDGAVTYQPTGQYDWTDPSTGSTYQIPTFSAYQQLSPQQEAIKKAGDTAELNLANLAAGQSARLQNLLGSPITYDGIPDRPGIPGRYEYGNFQGYTGLDAGYADGGQIQRDFNRGAAGNITRSYGTDFSEDRQRVEQALMDRMQPYLDRDEDRLRSQLANQGLMMGSEGYQRGVDDFTRQANDARLGAILSAGEEQGRMVGMERDRAAFENMAQQQGYGQILGQAQFRNQAQQQAFGQDRTNIDSSNAALQQMYDNYFRAQSANNQLQDSRFNQDAARYGMQTDARNSALQEMYQLRNQPINEISALLSGAQVSQPSFVNTGQYNIPTTDYAGIVSDNYNQQLARAQMRGGFGQQMLGGLFGLGAGYLAGM